MAERDTSRSGSRRLDSRYRYTGDVVRRSGDDGELVSTGLRRRPERTGSFRHLLRQGERLDHLGQQYYRRPHRWWEICDANPDVLSPLRLVGAEPVEEARLRIPADAGIAWHTVLDELSATPGVDEVSLVDATEPAAGPVPAREVTVLTVRFNRYSTTSAALTDVLAANGVPGRLAVVPGPEGTSIVVPPPSGGG